MSAPPEDQAHEALDPQIQGGPIAPRQVEKRKAEDDAQTNELGEPKVKQIKTEDDSDSSNSAEHPLGTILSAWQRSWLGQRAEKPPCDLCGRAGILECHPNRLEELAPLLRELCDPHREAMESMHRNHLRSPAWSQTSADWYRNVSHSPQRREASADSYNGSRRMPAWREVSPDYNFTFSIGAQSPQYRLRSPQWREASADSYRDSFPTPSPDWREASADLSSASSHTLVGNESPSEDENWSDADTGVEEDMDYVMQEPQELENHGGSQPGSPPSDADEHATINIHPGI